MDEVSERELFRSLGKIEAIQERILSHIEITGQHCIDRHDKIDEKLDKLEHSEASGNKKLTGIASAISTAIASGVAAATAWLFKGN